MRIQGFLSALNRLSVRLLISAEGRKTPWLGLSYQQRYTGVHQIVYCFKGVGDDLSLLLKLFLLSIYIIYKSHRVNGVIRLVTTATAKMFAHSGPENMYSATGGFIFCYAVV